MRSTGWSVSGRLEFVVVVVEELLPDSPRDEDLLEIVQGGDREGDSGGGQGGADGGEREVTRFFAASELGVLQVEHAAVVAEHHPVDVGEENLEAHLASPDEAFSRPDLVEKVLVSLRLGDRVDEGERRQRVRVGPGDERQVSEIG